MAAKFFFGLEPVFKVAAMLAAALDIEGVGALGDLFLFGGQCTHRGFVWGLFPHPAERRGHSDGRRPAKWGRPSYGTIGWFASSMPGFDEMFTRRSRRMMRLDVGVARAFKFPP